MYRVEQYEITRRGSTDDKSAAVVNEFETLNQAKEFYNSIDLKTEWNGERMSRPANTMQNTVFAKELYIYDPVEDEYGDTLEYDEYTYKDYQATK